jgi:hypothetical protein
MKFVYRHYRIPAQEWAVIARRTGGRGKPPRCRRYIKGHTAWLPATRGGQTICMILDENDNLVVEGEAACSLSDNFNYRIGREISTGRALKALAQLGQ